jgi:glutamine synthetase
MCLIAMINQHIIFSDKATGVGPLMRAQVQGRIGRALIGYYLREGQARPRSSSEILIEMRDICDAPQEVGQANCRTLATYKELLFLDQHSNHPVPSSFEEFE